MGLSLAGCGKGCSSEGSEMWEQPAKSSTESQKAISVVMEVGLFLKGVCCLSQGLLQEEWVCYSAAVRGEQLAWYCSHRGASPPAPGNLSKAQPPSARARHYCALGLPVSAGMGGWLDLKALPCLTLRLVSRKWKHHLGNLLFYWEMGRISPGFHIVPPVLQLCQFSTGFVQEMIISASVIQHFDCSGLTGVKLE